MNLVLAVMSLPDTGIKPGELITALITAAGAIAAVSLGGFAAFQIVKKAMRWVAISCDGDYSRPKTALELHNEEYDHRALVASNKVLLDLGESGADDYLNSRRHGLSPRMAYKEARRRYRGGSR